MSFPISWGEADASSTSHVSISIGKSSVKYNNDHISAGAAYGPKLQHYVNTPFFHSTPEPMQHIDERYGSPSPGAFGHHGPPFYSSTPGPFYQLTPAPLSYGSSSEPNYYSHSTPKHENTHAVHVPKHADKERHFSMPKEIEKNMEELENEENMNKNEHENFNEKENIEESLEIETKSQKVVGEYNERSVKDRMKIKTSYHSTPQPEIYHPSEVRHAAPPHYHLSEEPLYIPKRHHSLHHAHPMHTQSYLRSYQNLHKSEDSHRESENNYDEVPKCAESDKYYCVTDAHYPDYEIMNAANKHADQLLALYADVADLNTDLSVTLPKKADGQESYVCPSDVTYAQLFRAKNTDGKWRIIVNNIKVKYETLMQNVRLEECLLAGDSCPLVPHCYESKCLQKFVYHRFLVYNPHDHYYPFSVELFKLPSSCACYLGTYKISH